MCVAQFSRNLIFNFRFDLTQIIWEAKIIFCPWVVWLCHIIFGRKLLYWATAREIFHASSRRWAKWRVLWRQVWICLVWQILAGNLRRNESSRMVLRDQSNCLLHCVSALCDGAPSIWSLAVPNVRIIRLATISYKADNRWDDYFVISRVPILAYDNRRDAYFRRVCQS